MTLSCPGDAYFVYESWPIYDQTKMTCFYFRLKNKLEPEVLNCQNRKLCRRVLYLQQVSNLQLATSNNIAVTFEELNDEGSDTTVFRTWNTVSTSLHDQTTQTVDLGGSDLCQYTAFCISACVPLHVDEGSPRHGTVFCGWFAVEPFLPPPPPHQRYAAGSRAFSAPPPPYRGYAAGF